MTDDTIPVPTGLNVPVAPESTPEAAPAKAPEPVKEAESQPVAEGSDPAEKAPEGEEKPKRPASGRIAELYAQKKTAEAEAAMARQESARLREELQKLSQRYSDPNTSHEEQEAIRMRHAVKAERVEQLAGDADYKAQLAAIRRAEAFHERVAAVKDRLPDFDVVVTPQTPISEFAADLIAESEVGPQIAYHLGKNPDIARRIASLPPHLQGAELARIEAKVSTPVRKVSAAPPPPPRVGGGASPSAKDPANMSMAEYAEWYRKRGAGA